MHAIGISVAVRYAEFFSWRARVIEAALAPHDEIVRDVAAGYPVETLIAIRSSERRELLDLAREVFEKHADEADVIEAAIGAFAALKSWESVEVAVACGRNLLSQDRLFRETS